MTALEMFEDFCDRHGVTISTATEPPNQPLLTKSGYDLSSVEWTPAQIGVHDSLGNSSDKACLISAIIHQLILQLVD